MNQIDQEPLSDLRCSECGRPLLPDDQERKWAKCRFCGKPVCFDCIRHVGTAIRGPFMSYVEVMRTCNDCYVSRG